jgi:GNAT superfamily N-acetyltransferase
MIPIADIIRFENNFARSFATAVERDYGTLFCNPENPRSHDSNHALILDLECDLDAAIADVRAFYRGLGLVPRVHHGFVRGSSEILLPKLRAAGFETEIFDERFFVWSRVPSVKPVGGFELRRVRELDRAIIKVLGVGDVWTAGVIEAQILRDDYHLLAGYVRGASVALAELDVAAGISRVDGVVTHPDHRRKGYGRALMRGVVNYHREISRNALYLYSGNPSAIRIYEETGFEKIDWEPRKWSAWLPLAS